MSELAILIELIAGLNLIVLERLSEGTFKNLGRYPQWFLRLHPSVAPEGEILKFEARSGFLSDFLVEAENFWGNYTAGKLKSGPWDETGPSKQDYYHLEASATFVSDTKILVIELLGEVYEEKTALLQKIRETTIANEYLTQEMQNKEVHLRCLIYDLIGPLNGITHSFSSLDRTKMNRQENQSLEIGLKQLQRLEKLIQEIQDVFKSYSSAI
jgi:hypothetical protein